jgi:hypothetical protein
MYVYLGTGLSSFFITRARETSFGRLLSSARVSVSVMGVERFFKTAFVINPQLFSFSHKPELDNNVTPLTNFSAKLQQP